MTIELTREQETLVRDLVASGRYESVEAFVEAAIAAAYSETERFAQWAHERHAQAAEDVAADRVVSVPKGKMAATLAQHRNSSLPD